MEYKMVYCRKSLPAVKNSGIYRREIFDFSKYRESAKYLSRFYVNHINHTMWQQSNHSVLVSYG